MQYKSRSGRCEVCQIIRSKSACSPSLVVFANVWLAKDISSVIHLNDKKSGIKANETFPMMIGRRMTKLFADPTQTHVPHNMVFMFVYQKSVLSPAQPNFFTGKIM